MEQTMTKNLNNSKNLSKKIKDKIHINMINKQHRLNLI